MSGRGVRVGVFGATGYMGGEALRVLLGHPEFEIAWAASRGGDPVELHHPNLLGCGVPSVGLADAEPADAVLVALPTEPSIEAAVRFVEAGSRVVDLGAAFRLRDRADWERTYALAHPRFDLADEAPYGIGELHGGAIADARIVANPGCFSTAAILALAPLMGLAGIDRQRIHVTALSGTAGMGAELARPGHHPEIAQDLVAYNLAGHRHTLEIEQELGWLSGAPVRVQFAPVYVPVVRGILALCQLQAEEVPRRDTLLARLRDFYVDSPFVHVHDLPPEDGAAWQQRAYPGVAAVAGTNRCHLGVEVDPERGGILVLAALDSLGKGGAQAGIENLNRMFGLEVTAGLEGRALHP